MKIEHATPAQFEAIMTTEENVLVLAGPGSGKTATTVARIRKLVEDGVNPQEIVCLTFTNAAARELEERLLTIRIDPAVMITLEAAVGSLFYCGTLHGFALRMLKRFGEGIGYGDRMSVISPESASDLLESKAQSLGSKATLKQLLELKRVGLSPILRMSVEGTVIASYYQELRDAGIVDFDILLEEFGRLVATDNHARNEIRTSLSYLFVDEVQDSGGIDWMIYDALPIRWKFMVGDPDQAIFGFRGGQVGRMMTYAQKLGTHVILLEENYRSGIDICDAANRLIRHNKNRMEKRTVSALGVPAKIICWATRFNEGDEIGAVAKQIGFELKEAFYGPTVPEEIAVIARTNDIAYQFQRTLKTVGLPVVEREKSDLPRDWRFAKAAVELLVNPRNATLAYFFIIEREICLGQTPKQARQVAHLAKLNASQSGIHMLAGLSAAGGTTLKQLPELLSLLGASLESRFLVAEKIREVGPDGTLLELALAMGSQTEQVKEAGEGIKCLTIHGAKGLEFDVVFLVGFDDEVIPGKRKDVNVEEERRLAYVALTRARKRVYISNAASRVTPWGQIVSHKPSRFIEELS